MSNLVTQEMISAYVDGELSATDKAIVEDALSADESLRDLFENYNDSTAALKASAEFVSNTVTLPGEFTSRVMEKIRSHASAPILENESREEHLIPHEALNEQRLNKNGPTGNQTATVVLTAAASQRYSLRTWIEVIAATVAIVIVIYSWTGKSPSTENIASPGLKDQGGAENKDIDKPGNDLHMLGSKNGQFKNGSAKKVDLQNQSNPTGSTSREFSIFVDAKARPQIDRFWIMSDYEVTAAENTPATGTTTKVNVLLIDAKKTDAVKFFSQLSKWDSGFQIFHPSKSGNASWLTPFDVSKASQAEGDFWTLQIVLIDQ